MESGGLPQLCILKDTPTAVCTAVPNRMFPRGPPAKQTQMEFLGCGTEHKKCRCRGAKRDFPRGTVNRSGGGRRLDILGKTHDSHLAPGSSTGGIDLIDSGPGGGALNQFGGLFQTDMA